MGRRLHILVGMTLAVAVVVPLALAQQKDPRAGAGIDAETVLDLGAAGDLPAIPQTELPPQRPPGPESPAAAKPSIPRPLKNQNAGALTDAPITKGSAFELEPTPGAPLGSNPLAASEVARRRPGHISTRSRWHGKQVSSDTDRAGGSSQKEPGGPDEAVPALPPVGPLEKPGAMTGLADLPAGGTATSSQPLHPRAGHPGHG